MSDPSSSSATPVSPEDAADVSVLQSTLFRFASCEDDKFESTVTRVLPKLLPLFLRPSPAIRDSLMLICNHVNKRLKALPNLRLPVAELLELYHLHAREANSGYFVTFVLMYIEKGFPRLTTAERVELAHKLLPGISARAPQQQKTLLHTFFRCLLPADYHLERLSEEEREKRWGALKESAADQAVLLEFMLDVLLWAPVFVPPPPKNPMGQQGLPTVASVSAAAAAAASAQPAEPLIPDGLSPAALATITLDHTLPSSTLQSLKSASLNFLDGCHVFSESQMLPLALAGSSVGNSEVVHVGEALLKRLKHVNLEDAPLIQKLFAMYLGSMDQQTLPLDQRRKPASYTMKNKILHYLNRSKLSVSMLQPALRVIMDSFFHPASTPKLKQAGLMYTAWLIQQQPNAAHLYSIAPVLLNALLKFLATLSKPASQAQGEDVEMVPEKQTSTGIILAQLRGTVYQLIGQLSLKRPDLFNSNLKMMSLFFKALQEEANDVVLQNIHEGLSMLRSAYVGVNEGVQQQLQQVLLSMMIQPDKRVRLNALQCFNRLFNFQEVLARYLCILASNEVNIEVRDECARGLTPFIPRDELEAEREKQRRKREQERKEEQAKKQREQKTEETQMTDVGEEESKSPEPLSPSSVTSPSPSPPAASPSPTPTLPHPLLPMEAAKTPYPSFSSLVSFAHAHILAPSPPSADDPRFTPAQVNQLTFLKANLSFDVRALPKLLDFLYDTLKQNALYTQGGKKEATKDAMDTSSSSEASSSPAKEKAATGLTDDEMHTLISEYVSTVLMPSEESRSIPSDHRSLMLYQSLIEYSLSQRIHDVQSSASQHLVRLVSLVPDKFAPGYAARLGWIESNMTAGIQNLRVAMAQLLQLIAEHLQPNGVLAELMQRFLKQLREAEKVVGPSRDDVTHGCILALGVLVAEAMRRNKVEAGVDADSDEDTRAKALFPLPLLSEIVLECARKLDGPTFTRTPHITAAAIISIGRMGAVGRLPIPVGEANTTEPKEAVPTTRYSLVQSLFALQRGSERKAERVVEESIHSLSQLCIGDRSTTLLNEVLNGIFQAANTKHEELHFAYGEALSVIAKHHQHALPASAAEGSSGESASAVSASSSTFNIPAEQDVLYSILPRLFKLIAHGSSVQRTAACTWLLCLVKYSWQQAAIQHYFTKIQASFSVALTDSSQFTQEVAAKGMSLLYEHSQGDTQQQLIEELMKTFSSGQRKVNADTLITLDEEKGEFSTYKELVEVAKDMQKPDLVYNFMDLAAHHSIWSSKLGAAFSLSSILQVNDKLGSQLGSILPKLYRYQFDTNTKIQSSMRRMWQSLVSNPREAINQHFDAIITDLLTSMGDRQYRVRNSACLALCELLHGRNMDQLDAYLDRLWVCTFRNLDDVNEVVRKSATQLAGSMSHLSIRLCDTKFSNRTAAQKALNIVLPVLLTQGVTSKAKEIQSVSIRAVLAIIKIGGPNLRPHLATLIGTLLESMSNLEPQVFSYLQFHAASMQMTEEQIERARLAMASGGVLAEALSQCLLVVDEESMPSILAKLTDIINTGLGLPTLTAAAKFIISLVSHKSGPAMREHVAPLIVQLQQGLSDQSPTLRKSYADALGYLCKVAKRKRTEKLLHSLLDLYQSDKSTDTSRLVSGLALRSIVRQAGDVVRTHFMLELVPVAWMASHDNTPSNPDIAKAWGEAFEELVPALDAGVSLYLKECAALCRKVAAESQVYALRHIALLALKHLILACKARFAPELDATFALLLKLLPGRLWTGKEVALDALVFLAQECGSQMTPAQGRQTLTALQSECTRNKTEYKREAIRCMGKAALCFPHLCSAEIVQSMREVLQPILDLSSSSSKEATATGSSASSSSSSSSTIDEKESGPDLLLVTYSYSALADLIPSPQAAVNALYALRTAGGASTAPGSAAAGEVNEQDWYESQKAHAEWAFNSLLAGLEKGFSWTVRASIWQALKRVCQEWYAGEELEPTTAGSVSAKKSYGPSLVQPDHLHHLASSLLKHTGLLDPKFPLVRARAIELLQGVAERQAVWQLLVAEPNRAIARELNQQLLSMRMDTDATVLRSAPAIQSKLAASIGNAA